MMSLESQLLFVIVELRRSCSFWRTWDHPGEGERGRGREDERRGVRKRGADSNNSLI